MKIKGYKDYLEKVYDEFKDVDEKAIANLVRHGLNTMGFFIQKGCDVFIYNHRAKLYYYLGEITPPDERTRNSTAKLRKKLRALHKLAKRPHDDVFYFGLTEEEYKQHLEGGVVKRVWLCKILREAHIQSEAVHFFKVHQPLDKKAWVVPMDNYETANAEYIQRRDGKGFSSFSDSK